MKIKWGLSYTDSRPTLVSEDDLKKGGNLLLLVQVSETMSKTELTAQVAKEEKKKEGGRGGKNNLPPARAPTNQGHLTPSS